MAFLRRWKNELELGGQKKERGLAKSLSIMSWNGPVGKTGVLLSSGPPDGERKKVQLERKSERKVSEK